MYGYYTYFNKCIHLLNKVNYILSTSLKVLNYFKCTFSYYCSFEPVFLTQVERDIFTFYFNVTTASIIIFSLFVSLWF